MAACVVPWAVGISHSAAATMSCEYVEPLPSGLPHVQATLGTILYVTWVLPWWPGGTLQITGVNTPATLFERSNRVFQKGCNGFELETLGTAPSCPLSLQVISIIAVLQKRFVS